MPMAASEPQRLTISTERKDQVIDLTNRIETLLQRESAMPEAGICVVFAAHTTCAVTTADLDPGTDQDLLDALRAFLPRRQYRHPHDPAHAPDHILSSLLGPSVMVPFARGRLLLGVWQRVILVELDGPRERALYVSILG